MKASIIGVILILLLGCDGNKQNDVLKQDADAPSIEPAPHQIVLDARLKDWAKGAVTVKAVVFDCAEGDAEGMSVSCTDRRLIQDGVEHPFIVGSASKYLSTEDVVELANFITGEQDPSGAAGCYIPHHGLIFYAADGSIVAHLEVCLMCFGYRSLPTEGLSPQLDYDGLAKLFRKIGLPVYDVPDDWSRYFKENQRKHSN